MSLAAAMMPVEVGPNGSGSQGLVCGPRSPLAETRRTAARIAGSDATVLLTGETGTGKEVFARFIHTSSPRAPRAFVPVNCGAIPENLLESELFGYVRGAFTGALQPRRGRVAMADGGTLFLDEIGELPLPLQVKLLRLLQERSYEPVGSSESVSANFRLVAATNRDLAEEVKAGRFRADLYYRLFVCPIRLPALRERPGDVGALFAHFWAKRGETRPVEPAVLRCLEAYSWPGNVRELENLIERVSVCAEGPVIRVLDLPPEMLAEVGMSAPVDDAEALPPLREAAVPELPFLRLEVARAVPANPVAAPPPPTQLRSDEAPVSQDTSDAMSGVSQEMPALPRVVLPIDLPTMLRELENAYIDAALRETGHNKKEAARLLGMGRTTLVEKLRRRAAGEAADLGDSAEG